MRAALAAAALVLGVCLLAVDGPGPRPFQADLALAGDVMLGRGVAQAHSAGDWQAALAALAPAVAASDLGFANLESPLTGAPLERPALDLRAPAQAAAGLHAAGFRLLSLANNHALDAGPQGLEDTRRVLASEGLRSLGPEPEALILRLGNLRLAWLAFDDVSSPLDVPRVSLRLAEVRRQADAVAVSIHWGSELEMAPNLRQQTLAQALAAAGADLIVGHHPHVLQPVEWVWGAGRGRPTLVAFSLGNALFDQPAPPAARTGALLMVRLGAGGVTDACALPFQIDPLLGRAQPADAETAARVRRSLRLPCVETPTSEVPGTSEVAGAP